MIRASSTLLAQFVRSGGVLRSRHASPSEHESRMPPHKDIGCFRSGRDPGCEPGHRGSEADRRSNSFETVVNGVRRNPLIPDRDRPVLCLIADTLPRIHVAVVTAFAYCALPTRLIPPPKGPTLSRTNQALGSVV